MVRNYKKDEKSDPGCSTKKWMVRKSFKPGDIGYLTYLHGTIYAKEYGYDQTFKAYVAAGLAEFLKSFNPNKDRMCLAEVDDQIIGVIAVVGHSKLEAQLRWFLVHPDYRGHGLGNELMKEALGFCKECKYKTVFLWTTSDLHAASRLYTCVGFKKVEDKTHEIWGKRVTEERYELQL
jgi:N-acetylglutamate synthase-like GNAT family acetyltransferase